MPISELLSKLFAGVGTLIDGDAKISGARILLMLLGMALVWLGKRGTLEPLLMIPMGLGMAAVNAGVLVLDPVTASHVSDTGSTTATGTLFVAPLVSNTESLMYLLQVDFLQPVYTFMFGNGLIACLVFMGIGSLLDMSFLMARPFLSMFLAICAELGTVATFPIAVACGLKPGEAAAIAMVGGADGPMVLYTSLSLAKDLFVPITVVAYLYLGLTYGGYPYLIRLLVPRSLRGLPMQRKETTYSSGAKLAFTVVACTLLCLLFPVAAPLFFSLFLGVAIRESGLKHFNHLVNSTILYGSTLFLGLLLGVLCEASTILDPRVLLLLLLGILSLLLSGIGGLIGGYIAWFLSGKKINPLIGIAGVSCVPTTAKVAQKEAAHVNREAMILPEALGANISGVITTAILTGIYVTLVPLLTR